MGASWTADWGRLRYQGSREAAECWLCAADVPFGAAILPHSRPVDRRIHCVVPAIPKRFSTFLNPPPGSLPPEEARTERNLRTWGVEALVALDAILISAANTFDPRSIAHPHLVSSQHPFSGWATAFYLGVLAIPALVWLRASLNRRSEIRVRSRAFGPLNVWHGVQPSLVESLVESVRSQRSRISDEQKRELLQGHARVSLTNVLTIVEGFSTRRPGDRYAANIMRFVPRSMLAGAFEQRFRQAIRIEPLPPVGWKSVKGILLLDPSLSAATDEEGVDPRVTEFGLLLPTPPNGEGVPARGQYLPGAPDAYFSKELVVIDSQQLLRESDLYPKLLGEEGAGRLRAYFDSADGRYIRSIVSHPILRSEKHYPKAVLNIHSNTSGLFFDDLTRIELFYLLRPASLTLYQILDELEKVERRMGVWP